MTKQYISGLLFFAMAIVLGSCYKDKGNYDYTNINKLVLQTTLDTVNVVLPDSLKVNLSIEQSVPNAVDLSFEWVLYPASGTALTRRTLDTTRNLKAKITELPGSYYLVVYVKDRNTGIEYQKRLYISVLSAYSEGWLVVEENNGACDISMITPVDTIFRNIYSSANKGQKLPAGTRRIPEIKTGKDDQKVFIISPTDMVQVNTSDFIKIMNFPDFFWQAPTVIQPQEYFVNGNDELFLNNGKIYGRSLITSGIVKLNLPPNGNYYIAPFETYSSAYGYSVYDTISQQLLKLDLNAFTLTPYANPTVTADFKLNNIGKKMLYAELNTTNQWMAYFKNNNDDSLFAFAINLSSTTNPAIRRYDGLNAPGMINARLFVGSRSVTHLYYASGNSIYKLDVEAKTATPVYTFPGGTEIRAMKMYRNLKNNKDPNNNNLIAVATHENGQGKIYYFPIATTGNFTNNTYSKVFTGFNKINEITFKSLK